MKSISTLIISSSLFLFSCKKEKAPEVDVPDTYGEKILGTWNRDSVIRFDADTNFISKTTDPVTYKYTNSSVGANYYEWLQGTTSITVEMDESQGVMYQHGEETWRWKIQYIDAHTCYLFRPQGTFFPFIEKIYLSR